MIISMDPFQTATVWLKFTMYQCLFCPLIRVRYIYCGTVPVRGNIWEHLRNRVERY